MPDAAQVAVHKTRLGQRTFALIRALGTLLEGLKVDAIQFGGKK